MIPFVAFALIIVLAAVVVYRTDLALSCVSRVPLGFDDNAVDADTLVRYVNDETDSAVTSEPRIPGAPTPQRRAQQRSAQPGLRPLPGSDYLRF